VRRKVIWIPAVIVVILLAIGGSFLAFAQPSDPLAGKEQLKVQLGTLEQTVSASGTVMAASDAKLSFDSSGKVLSVNVKRGDQVKKGDVIAVLDDRDLQLGVDQAQAGLDSAQASLDKIKAGATQTEIATAQSNVAQAVSKLNDVRTNNVTAQDVQSARAQLESAQAKLDQVKKGSTPESIAQAQAKVDQAQANLDSSKANLASQKEQARIAWESSGNDVRSAQATYGKAQADWDYVQSTDKDPSTGRHLDANQKLQFQTTRDTALLNEQNAEKAMAEKQVAYENAKTQEIQGINTAQAQLDDANSALQTVQKGSTDDDVRIAQAAVDQAQANLDKVQRGPDQTTLNAAEVGAAQAETALNEVTAGPKATDLEVAMASVKQADAQLKLAQVKLDNAKLLAPFDGVVALVGVDPGEATGPTVVAAEVVDPTNIHIDASVAESDIASVSNGQKVTVTLDGLPDQELTGVVNFISPVARVDQNVTLYTVSATLDKFDSRVKTGMSGTVNISTLSKPNVLLVPNRALKLVDGKQTVLKLVNGKPVETVVKVGLSNEMDSEIIQGLSANDTVLVDSTIKRNPISISA
jgi:HlyD family secretion protein